MTMKRSLLLSSFLVLTLVGLSTLPTFAQPEPGFGNPPSDRPGPGFKGRRQLGQKLNLTDAQKAQLQEIRQTTHSRVEAVLTADQKAQLETAKQQGTKLREAFQSLNLSDDQRQQIQTIREEGRQQMESVLTSEQREQKVKLESVSLSI
jgi:Spy/CpxP family protein refolding chaperone